MNVLDTETVDHAGLGSRRLHLASGGPGDLPPDLRYLAIACDPGRYAPEDNEVIRELDALGVSVESLSYRPEFDFRPALPVWVSAPHHVEGISFDRLLVWEPGVREGEAASFLPAVREGFQALALVAGRAGAESAAFLHWPGTANDSPEGMFREQFFSAMSLAARNDWRDLYLVVHADDAGNAEAWFVEHAANYRDPPVFVSETMRARFDLPSRLSECVDADMDGAFSSQGSQGFLTYRQFLAVRSYTWELYQPVNAALRHGDSNHPEFIQWLPTIEAISTGLAGLTNDLSPVGRAVVPFDGFDDIYMPGRVATELAYTSTGRNQIPSHLFDPRYWLFQMEGALGKNVAPISHFPREEETLFDSGLEHLVWFMDPEWEEAGEGLYRGLLRSHESAPRHLGISYYHL